MLLPHAHMSDAIGVPRVQPDILVDAAGRKARSPVPAEGALLLADIRRAADRIVPLRELMKGETCANVIHRVREMNRELIVARPQPRSHRKAIAGKHVLSAGDF